MEGVDAAQNKPADFPAPAGDQAMALTTGLSNDFAMLNGGIAQLLGPSIGADRLANDIDLTSLINSPFYHFDVTIHQDHTGSVWNLPRELEQVYEGLDLDRVQQVVEASTLPNTSIHALFDYFCTKSLRLYELHNVSLQCSHLLSILEACGLDERPLLSQLVQEVLPKLSFHDACKSLLDVWMDPNLERTLDDAIVRCLLRAVRQTDDEPSAERYTLIMNTLTSLSRPHAAAEERLFQLFAFISGTSTSPTNLLSFFNQEKPALFPYPIELQHPPADATLQSVVERLNDFVFAVGDPAEKGYFKASLVHMLPQWRWIRTYLRSGTVEAIQRVASLSNSPKIMAAILECMHTGLNTVLTAQEAESLLENALDFDLVSQDGLPLAPFEGLVTSCRELCPAFVQFEQALESLDAQTNTLSIGDILRKRVANAQAAAQMEGQTNGNASVAPNDGAIAAATIVREPEIEGPGYFRGVAMEPLVKVLGHLSYAIETQSLAAVSTFDEYPPMTQLLVQHRPLSQVILPSTVATFSAVGEFFAENTREGSLAYHGGSRVSDLIKVLSVAQEEVTERFGDEDEYDDEPIVWSLSADGAFVYNEQYIHPAALKEWALSGLFYILRIFGTSEDECSKLLRGWDLRSAIKHAESKFALPIAEPDADNIIHYSKRPEQILTAVDDVIIDLNDEIPDLPISKNRSKRRRDERNTMDQGEEETEVDEEEVYINRPKPALPAEPWPQ